jgi:iron complex outermembrane receptor protein
MKLSLIWISIALIFLIIPRPAISENQMNASDSLPTYWLNEIVVLEDRLPVVGNATMHQINADQIAQLDARNPASAMHYVPGLQVSRISKGESMVKIRGFDQRQISVFLDGIPISVPYNGRIDLAQLPIVRPSISNWRVRIMDVTSALLTIIINGIIWIMK